MGALNGYKILDFSTLLPGPYATMTLADMGAEVLKVSGKDKYDLVVHWPPIIKDAEVTSAQAWLGRNKKTIYLNIKKPSAAEAVKRLIMEYDIVVEQFRPGVMSKLGIGYEQLKEINTKIIYCAITGYGQTGPFAFKAGHDINYLSRAGISCAAGRKDGGPSLYNFQIADVAGGSMNAVASILAAIIYREKTGKGQFIDVSMQDSVIPFNSMDGASYFAGGPLPSRESGMLNGGQIYDFYETSDGEYMSVGSLEPKFFAALCKGLEHPEWSDGKILETDLATVKTAFREKFKSKTRAQWTEIFSNLDACVEPVMNLLEVSKDEHLRSRDMWPSVEVPCTNGVKITQMGCPLNLSECQPEYRHAGYPEGYHTEQILPSLGYNDEQIKEMINS
ncbi:MAG: CaiB/BaiF CoA-transferase family protein [Eubacteriales bacterium]|nr:CaiB/BaiF CoA-transferase family protein [Eubacteriales bacterium]